MIQIAVCDDNPTIRLKIIELLKEYALSQSLELELTEYSDGGEIVEAIRTGNRFHLIYMDIEMKRMDGLEAAAHIREEDAIVPLIFVTSYDTYALKGYEVMSMAYLLKPIDREMFIRVFEKALGIIRKNEKLFIFETLRCSIKLPVKDILYFQSNNKKVEAKMSNGVESFSAKLDIVEVQLERDGYAFLRIHKSYLVNFSHIIRFNSVKVTLTNGEVLQISEKYSRQAKEKYIFLVESAKGF